MYDDELAARIRAEDAETEAIEAAREYAPPPYPAPQYPPPDIATRVAAETEASEAGRDLPAVYYPNVPQLVYGYPVAPPAPRQAERGTVIAAWILAVLTFGYFLPWAIAATRAKPNHGGVAVVNALVGWTGIGWLVALVMACV